MDVENDTRRTNKQVSFCKSNVDDRFQTNQKVQEKLPGIESLVREGKITPGYASDSLLREFLGSQYNSQ